MRIQHRLTIIMLLPLVLGLLIIAGQSYFVYRANLIEKEASRVSQFERQLFDLEILLSEYILHPEQPRVGGQISKKHEQIKRSWGNLPRGDERATWDKLEKMHQQMFDHFNRLKLLPLSRGGALVNERRSRIIDQLILLSQRMAQVIHKQMDVTLEQRERATHLSSQVTIWLTLGFALIIAFSSRYLTHILATRIQDLQRGFKTVTQGNLEHRLHLSQEDELGELGNSFNQMVIRLLETLASRDQLNDEVRERKKVEEAYREAIEKYKSLFENMDSGFAYLQVIFDERQDVSDLIFIEVNGKFGQIFQEKQEDLIGKRESTLRSHFDQFDINLYHIFAEVALRNQIRQVEVYDQKQNRHLLLSAYSNNLGYVAVMFSDITERKRDDARLLQAKEAAESLSRMKSNFLSILSHELRTSLHGMLGVVELLRQAQKQADWANKISIIQNTGQDLIHTLNGIMDFSYLEDKVSMVSYQPFDLVDTVEEVCQSLQPLALRKNLMIDLGQDSKLLPYCNGDRNLLRQILHHLLFNHLQHCSGDGIQLKLDQVKVINRIQTLRFEIRSSGSSFLHGQWEKLQRTPDLTYDLKDIHYSYSSMGLYIAMELLVLSGSLLHVEEEQGGNCCWFELNLPLGDQAEAMAQPALSEKPVGKAARDTSILLVDDEETNLRVAQEMIEAMGYQVATVNQGTEAIEMLAEKRFDLVLMDWRMPGLDGLETTKLIRAKEIPQAGRVPIIALTAAGMYGDREQCLAAGMDDYLAKPFNQADLQELIIKWALAV